LASQSQRRLAAPLHMAQSGSILLRFERDFRDLALRGCLYSLVNILAAVLVGVAVVGDEDERRRRDVAKGHM
jgi:hypothetical protein